MEVSKKQIEEWKAQHGDVWCIEVDGKKCYLKRPSRQALGFASMSADKNPIKANETLLNDCWLGGDEEIKTNDTLFLSVSGRLAEIIQLKETELKKL